MVWNGLFYEAERTQTMSMMYGEPLSRVEKMLYEAENWNDLPASLATLGGFPGVRIIYVWLGSSQYTERGRSKRGLAEQAQRLMQRDRRLLRGRDLTVEYIDYDGHHYGGIWTGR